MVNIIVIAFCMIIPTIHWRDIQKIKKIQDRNLLVNNCIRTQNSSIFFENYCDYSFEEFQ